MFIATDWVTCGYLNRCLMYSRNFLHQWYWEYEYSDYSSPNIKFDSYMIPTDSLTSGQIRLLEVDNRLVLPAKTNIRVVVTATDVLHSFAVPSLGIKLDAIPGRLNQTPLYMRRTGVFYGL